MRVRDAMVSDPRTLAPTATAQEAARLLVRPEVGAVIVCDAGRLVGLVTRRALLERVVAAGRDPRATTLAEIVEGDILTVEAETGIEDAYRMLEDTDYERVPVVEQGRLVGVLHRSALQRRLAEDEEPEAAQ